MDIQSTQHITLPTGKVVHLTTTEEEWWTQDGGFGYMHIDMLAPDPKQPRQHYDQLRLEELTQSVSAQGVRETIIVSPVHLCP